MAYLPEKQYGLLFLGFSQDGKSFNVGTDKGFENYSATTLRKTPIDFAEKKYLGGISCVDSSASHFALVGGGLNPCFSQTQIHIFDYKKEIALVEGRGKIFGVKLKQDLNIIVIVLETRICLYNMLHAHVINSHETCENKSGVCAISNTLRLKGVESADNGDTGGVDSVEFYIACPALQVGNVRVEHYVTQSSEVIDNGKSDSNSINKSRIKSEKKIPVRVLTTKSKKSYILNAHQNPIASLVFNHDATLLATASVLGTLIRIYDVKTEKQTHELRRSHNHARIHSISFNRDSTLLLCSSERSTIHIFSLGTKYKISNESNESNENYKSSESCKSTKVISSSNKNDIACETLPDSDDDDSDDSHSRDNSDESIPRVDSMPFLSTIDEEERKEFKDCIEKSENDDDDIDERKEIKEEKKTEEIKNPISLLSYAYSILPWKSKLKDLTQFQNIESYLKCEWSFCQYKLAMTIPHIVSFLDSENLSSNSKIQIICADGNCYQVSYNSAGESRLLHTTQLTFKI